MDLFGTPVADLAHALGGSGRARIPWRLLREGRTLDELDPGAHRRLAKHCELVPLQLQTQTRSECGTSKMLLRLRDGRFVETVVIPNPGRTTVCVSSQVGCARGCSFCVTATMGLVRNLSAAEITAQVWFALRVTRDQNLAPLRNVVLMGMGEPLDNLTEVERAIAVLTDPLAFGIGPSRITLSTVGTSPRAIERAGELPVRLAWSLHSADPEVRRRLVPTDRHTLGELRDAFKNVLHRRASELFVEVTLLDEVNDSPEAARHMADFLEPLQPGVRVNLLPMNPGRDEHRPASVERTEVYRQVMYERGYRCILRRARGGETNAACGQLAVLPTSLT